MRVSIGSYVIDTLTLDIARAGRAVAIEPKVFDLLVLLIENRHRVVPRDEIVEKLWQGRAISDDALSSCVKAARRALGDDGRSQGIIRTIHRRGFRLVGEVVVEDTAAPAGRISEPAPASADGGGNDAVPRAAVSRPAMAPLDKPSIAVLPFENMSADPQQAFFADGIAEDILTTLAKIRHILVIDRNSSFTYKGRSLDVRKVGEELGVRYVLDGSVQKSRERVRVSAQLVDCTDRRHLWADRFDGSLQDVFDFQDRITEEIVTALEVELTEGELVRGWRKRSGDLKAYEAYHRARDFFMQFTREASLRAHAEATRAVEINPEYWDAWLMLGYTSNMAARLGWSDDPGKSLRFARECVARVLAADPTMPEAHSLAGGIALTGRDYPSALASCRQAVALGPNSPDCYHMLAIVLCYAGQPHEAVGLERQALRLNPLNPTNYLVELGRAYVQLGKLDEAKAVLQQVVTRRPRWMNARALLVAACHGMGLASEAVEQAQEILRLRPSFRLGDWSRLQPYREASDLEAIVAPLRKVGLLD